MKIQIALLTVALLAGCAQQPSVAEEAAAPAPAATEPAPAAPAASTMPEGMTASAADMGMAPAEHEKMAADAAAMGMDAKAHEAMGDASAKPAGADAPAMAMGVVKSIDTASGKVTIAHEPIASLKWPAMTMAFQATPEMLMAVKEGDRVHFEFTQHDGVSTLSALEPTK